MCFTFLVILLVYSALHGNMSSSARSQSSSIQPGGLGATGKGKNSAKGKGDGKKGKSKAKVDQRYRTIYLGDNVTGDVLALVVHGIHVELFDDMMLGANYDVMNLRPRIVSEERAVWM